MYGTGVEGSSEAPSHTPASLFQVWQQHRHGLMASWTGITRSICTVAFVSLPRTTATSDGNKPSWPAAGIYMKMHV